MKRVSRSFTFPVAIAVILLGMANLETAAQQPKRFAEAELFIELNDTDHDLGIHGSIDGQTWTDLEIEGPAERSLLNLVSRGRLRLQGMTQLAFESAEPTFEELAPQAFFKRFPEGRYVIEGRAQDGSTIKNTVVLSHVLAAPPQNVVVSGVAAAESCDVDPLPIVTAPVIVRWDPVTTSHPDVGRQGPVKIVRYQFFIERPGVKLSVDLPPDVTEFHVPPSLTALSDEWKYEIIARTSTGNNTAIESCFRLQ